MGEVIEDIAPIPLSSDQTRLAQNHQVLRDARLAHAQYGFQMAHAGLLRAKDPQDLDARRLADLGKQFCNFFFRVGGD
jgi:hypothetical protein